MGKFEFRARDENGNVVEDTIEAESRYDALAVLRARALTVVQLQTVEGGRSARPAAKIGKPRQRKGFGFGARGVSLSEMAIFSRQLSISVSSGVPLRDSLESIAEDAESQVMRRTLENVVSQLHEGRSFSEAIRQHRGVFSPLFVALIESAEESGSMSQTLEHLATSLERTDRLARKIRSITAYPMFIVFAFVVVCVLMTLLVLPKFQESFEQLMSGPSQLPKITEFVFSINEAIIGNFPVIVAGVAAIVALIMLFNKTETGAYRIDRLKLRLPLFGDIQKKIAITRICRNLAIMIEGGVPITTAIEIASGIAGNKVLERSMLAVRDRILQGADFSSSLGKEPDFPRLVVRMIGVGEASGRLPEVMNKVSDAYEDQVEGTIMMVTSLFEPIIICLFGIIILVLILAIYMPIFTIGSDIR